MKKQDTKKETRRQKQLAKQQKTAQTGKKGSRNKKAVSYELTKKGPKSLNALFAFGFGAILIIYLITQIAINSVLNTAKAAAQEMEDKSMVVVTEASNIRMDILQVQNVVTSLTAKQAVPKDGYEDSDKYAEQLKDSIELVSDIDHEHASGWKIVSDKFDSFYKKGQNMAEPGQS